MADDNDRASAGKYFSCFLKQNRQIVLCNTNTNTRPYVFTLSYIHNPCTCIRIGRPVPARLENGNGDFSASLAKWGQKLYRSETEPEPH